MDIKKLVQKRKRFITRLRHSKNIICNEIPEKNVLLCNGGQATGLEKDICLNHVHKLLPNVSSPKYIAEKGESYSYLVFDNVESAKLLYEKCNGLLNIYDDKGKTASSIYLAYVQNAPTDEVVCTNENPIGLTILPNFINKEEEERLQELLDIVSIENGSNLKNRLVKHYGYAFRYGSNDVDLNAPLTEKIPEECNFIWDRLKHSSHKVSCEPDQLTVNKYIPGQGIPCHVDKHSPFGDVIMSLSLGSSVLMDWRHSSGQYVPVLVPARSLLIMKGEARYDWQHGIQPRTWDPVINIRTTPTGDVRVITSDTTPRRPRLSLTFRWTRSGPCQCQYKTLCDSAQTVYKDDIGNELASKLEDLHVHQVYEKIAGHFSTTRHKPWPKVVEFMKNVPSGSIVFDLGCGNGKNILNRNDIFQIAGERSSGLLEECKAHVDDIGQADCVRLDLLHNSLNNASADYIICIAVIHHFSSKARRIQAISTIARLLRPSGKALITVWAKDQTKSNYLNKTKDKDVDVKDETRVSVAGLNLPVHENRTQFQHNDLLVPWKLREVNRNKLSNKSENTLLRYYHVFQENELVDLCLSDPKLEIDSSFYEEGNWCVICNKI